MNNIHPGVVLGVKLQMARLTLDELVALYLAVNNPYGSPKETMGYQKVASLFTEQDGTKMHADAKAVFCALAQERLPK
jgi:hypothetical protein